METELTNQKKLLENHWQFCDTEDEMECFIMCLCVCICIYIKGMLALLIG